MSKLTVHDLEKATELFKPNEERYPMPLNYFHLKEAMKEGYGFGFKAAQALPFTFELPDPTTIAENVKFMRAHVASYKTTSRHRQNCLALCDIIEEQQARVERMSQRVQLILDDEQGLIEHGEKIGVE